MSSESDSENERNDRVSPGTTTAATIHQMSGHWIAITNSPTIQKDPLLSKFPLISYRNDPKSFSQNLEAHHASTSTPPSYSQPEPMASTISLGVVSLSQSVWSSEITSDPSAMDVDSSEATEPPPLLTSMATQPWRSQIINWSLVDITLIFFAHTMTNTILLYLKAFKTFFTPDPHRDWNEERYRQKVLRFIMRVRTLGLLLIFVWVGLWAPPTSVTAFITNYEGEKQAHLIAKIIRQIMKIALTRKHSENGVIHCTLFYPFLRFINNSYTLAIVLTLNMTMTIHFLLELRMVQFRFWIRTRCLARIVRSTHRWIANVDPSQITHIQLRVSSKAYRDMTERLLSDSDPSSIVHYAFELQIPGCCL